jgi:hypothetical protein
MMAEPAHGGAHDPGSPEPRKPDPRASGWAAAQRAMIAAAESNALAVSVLAARPGDAKALEQVRLSIAVLQEMSETFRRLTTEDAVMAEERTAGYREGWAACKANRCRLELVDGGVPPGPH